ncbi:HAMP domain-containing methyl-accepting chemotaxis protein [Alteromonas facilis]|uniref:HAMP domain-containing methyl-accepting chemotaxis protein n=1 Tax=Alteromonas facilis TaxID=2048004 RepID=UPI000C29584A|nr:methyl-accepting chemotaxis protein [Alteromonas facilis]
MKLTVIRKIVLGFLALGILLVLTSFLSYLGLLDISRSAESVVKEKMPVQAKVIEIQASTLKLANITTNGFHERSLDALAKNRENFVKSKQQFESVFTELTALLSSNQAAALQANSQFLAHSEDMYTAREKHLQLRNAIIAQGDEVLAFTDEASALMMDLSYLSGNDPGLPTLIGAGTGIDNKLATMLGAIRELVNSNDAEVSQRIIEDLEYSVSNIQVDSDYINRLAETIENDGLVELFNEQFENLKASLEGDAGLFANQRAKLAAIDEAQVAFTNATVSLEQGLESIESLFSTISAETLSGQNDILDNVTFNIAKSVLISLVGLGAVVVLAVLATRSISVPLKNINIGLNKLIDGDLTTKLDDSGGSEFDKLATKVNELSGSLRALVGNILEQEIALDDVTRRSGEMSRQSLRQVDQQRQKIQVTSQNTAEVRHMSQTNLRQVEDSLMQLQAASEQSEKVVNLLEESRQQVTSQAKQAEHSEQIIARLDENSRNIGSILDVIKTIAEQTNLLALNAAIEAARAGEQGRGFAVVADEVRTLANRTHDSTEEIEKMIASLQTDASQAVSAISEGKNKANESVQVTQLVNEQVSEITRLVTAVARINDQIVKDTKEQDILLEQADGSLAEIVALAEQTAASTQQSSEVTGEIEAQMNSLKQAVEQFKV